MLNFLNRFKYFDIPLQVCAMLLAISGLALLYSTSLNSPGHLIFWRQLLFLAFGLIGFLFLSFFDYHTLTKANKIFYVLSLLVLLYLLFFGSLIRGGRRWLNFGFFYLQVAEFVKLVVILGLGRLLYLRRGQINSWTNLAWSFLYTAVPAVLIILEPDLGSALILFAVWGGILLISPIKKKFLIILLVIFLSFGGLTWKFLLKDFQKDRVRVFLNPRLDPRGRGYNVRQATIAVGSGQLFGQGLGQGLQSQNKFLPEQQTDFIFAASAEQVGFLGSFAILCLYFFFFFRLAKIITRAKDDLGMYLASGVFFVFFCHVVINIGMNIGLLPVTGIPLPFLSAGGSNLIVAFLMLGIVQNISLQSKTLRF